MANSHMLTAKLTKDLVTNSGHAVRHQVLAQHPLTLHAVCPAWWQQSLGTWPNEDVDLGTGFSNRELALAELSQGRVPPDQPMQATTTTPSRCLWNLAAK